MLYDAQGLFISAAAEDAVAAAYQAAIDGYLRYRIDTGERPTHLLGVAPDFAMAHVLKGYLALLGSDRAQLPRARKAHEAAHRWSVRATSRERAHVLALRHWLDGDLERALATWETILDTQPRDLLAFMLHHNVAFWHGQPARMLHRVEQVLPYWQGDIPGRATILACHAFALEESARYAQAEEAGRAALELEPGNPWATHALTHGQGMRVGERWQELADLAEARIGDCLSTFLLPHWMLALTGAGRWEAATRLLHAIRHAAQAPGADPERILQTVALPVCEAVRLHRLGEHAQVVATMQPALPKLQRLGGSHAQRDVFEQLYLDSAVRSNDEGQVRTRLAHAVTGHPVPPADRIGYAFAAKRYHH